MVLPSRISECANACRSRPVPLIASLEPALQRVIAAFVSFCNLAQDIEQSFLTRCVYFHEGSFNSMSRFLITNCRFFWIDCRPCGPDEYNLNRQNANTRHKCN